MTRALIGVALATMTSAATCARTADVPPAGPAPTAPELARETEADAVGARMHAHFALVTAERWLAPRHHGSP